MAVLSKGGSGFAANTGEFGVITAPQNGVAPSGAGAIKQNYPLLTTPADADYEYLVDIWETPLDNVGVPSGPPVKMTKKVGPSIAITIILQGVDTVIGFPRCASGFIYHWSYVGLKVT